MTTLLATVFVLGVLVFVHELGHFLTAKLFKIRVERFSLGYPPRLFGKRIGDTDYCVSAVPFGGYVKISGMVDESLDAKSLARPAEAWEFRSKPWLQKFLVVLAGSVMNLGLAYAVFTGAAWMQGVPEVKDPRIGEVAEGKPAALAGLKPGDRIVRVDTTNIATWSQLSDIIHASAGKTLNVHWTRGDSAFSKAITPVLEKISDRGSLREVGLIGILPQAEMRRVGLPEAAWIAGRYAVSLSKLVIVSIAKLVSGKESLKSLAGPVFIAKLAGESAKSGFWVLVEFMALLSLNLGILNLLPFPVLDGGHLLMLCIEGIIRREIPVKAKMVIQQAGMVLLLGLMVLAVYNDILRIFKH